MIATCTLNNMYSATSYRQHVGCAPPAGSVAVAHWWHVGHSAIGGSLNTADQLHLTSQPKVRNLQNKGAGTTFTIVKSSRANLLNAKSAKGRLLEGGTVADWVTYPV